MTSSKSSTRRSRRRAGPSRNPRPPRPSARPRQATLATLGNPDHPGFAQEMKLLAEMLEMAESARHQPDEKLKKLFAYIDQNMLEAPAPGSSRRTTWNDHRILIFTEYDDTLAYVRRQLEAHIQSSNAAGERLAVYKGINLARRRTARRSKRRSTPTPRSTRFGFCWRPMRHVRESIFRSTVSTCSTTTSPGTQPVSNSATVESTASFSPRQRSIAVTSSTKTERKTRSCARSSRRPRTSTASSAVSERSSTRT